jgi:hypothetical protein
MGNGIRSGKPCTLAFNFFKTSVHIVTLTLKAWKLKNFKLKIGSHVQKDVLCLKEMNLEEMEYNMASLVHWHLNSYKHEYTYCRIVTSIFIS